MTLDKVREVVRRYQTEGGLPPHLAVKVDDDLNLNDDPTSEKLHAHMCYMCVEILKMCDEGEGRTEKVMRWLGFMQGVLWGAGLCTLRELKVQNMPTSNDTAEVLP